MRPLIFGNNLETIDYVSDEFIEFEDHYFSTNVSYEIKKIVLSNALLKIFKKQSRSIYQCSKTDLKKFYSIDTIPYLTFREQNNQEIITFSEEGISYVLLIKIANTNEPYSTEEFNILENTNRANKKLSKRFAKKFKTMFFIKETSNSGSITIGVIVR